MPTKTDLLRQHIIGPAVANGGKITRGHVGQTHDDLGGSATPNDSRGFIMSDGRFMQRDTARDYLNSRGGDQFPPGSPTSEQLMLAVPLYESPTRRIYSIGGSRAVSVVKNTTSPGFEVAKLFLHNPNQISDGFTIDYSGLIPTQVSTEDEVRDYLERAQKEVQHG